MADSVAEVKMEDDLRAPDTPMPAGHIQLPAAADMTLPPPADTFANQQHPNTAAAASAGGGAAVPMVGSPVLTSAALPSALTSLSSSSPLAALTSTPTTATNSASAAAASSASASASSPSGASSGESLTLQQIMQLIDDLRSPDLPTRLNAFHQLPAIAAALGPLRTREELIGYLSEFIDDDDEVLLVLAAQLATLVEHIGGVPFAHVLLAPLEQLCATEESGVRDRAVASVVSIAERMSEVQLENYVLPLVRKLTLGEWFASRISAAALYPHVYPRIAEKHRKDMRALYVKLCTDDTPMVRRAAVTHLGPFALVVNPDYAAVKGELFPVFQRLSKDEQDSVRLLTVQAGVAISRVLKPAECVTKMLPVVFVLCEDKSWRVRYMVADKFCELCLAMGGGPEVKSDELVDKYVRLLQDDEAEVRTAAAQRVGEVARLIGASQSIKKLLSPAGRSPLQALVKDSSQYVRAALASTLMTLTSVLKKKDNVELVVPLFLTLLKDTNSEVRLNLISRLDAVTDVMSADELSVCLLKAIMELAADGKWRVRLQIIEHIPALARQLGAAFFDAKLIDLCMNWLGDSVYSIREAATANLTKLVHVYGVDWAQRNIVPKVVALADHRSYLYRLTAVFAIGDMAQVVGAASVGRDFVPVLSKLCTDAVPNVRFNCVKAIMSLAQQGVLGEGGDSVGALLPVVQRLVADTDNDVKYYAALCVQALQGQQTR